jgi:hypothetical protein
MLNLNTNIVGLTGSLTAPGLAIGTTQGGTGTVNTSNTLNFTIDGRLYTKSAATSAAVNPVIAGQTQGLLTVCLYIVQVDSSGTISTVKGEEILVTDLTAGSKVLRWPQPSDNRAVLGAFRITLASSATFTLGVTALNASNVTAVFYDLASVPSAPFTS